MPDNVKKLLAEGTDLDTVYAPYKTQMAAILEVNPQTISFTDPALRSAIGPNGEMPIYDFQRALRKDARWQYTNNAREDVFQSVGKVLQDFGFQGQIVAYDPITGKFTPDPVVLGGTPFGQSSAAQAPQTPMSYGGTSFGQAGSAAPTTSNEYQSCLLYTSPSPRDS